MVLHLQLNTDRHTLQDVVAAVCDSFYETMREVNAKELNLPRDRIPRAEESFQRYVKRQNSLYEEESGVNLLKNKVKFNIRGYRWNRRNSTDLLSCNLEVSMDKVKLKIYAQGEGESLRKKFCDRLKPYSPREPNWLKRNLAA